MARTRDRDVKYELILGECVNILKDYQTPTLRCLYITISPYFSRTRRISLLSPRFLGLGSTLTWTAPRRRPSFKEGVERRPEEIFAAAILDLTRNR